MFKHNLLIVFRNFKKYKSTFFINLVGLSTGLACALLIYLWVNDELHIDKFHKNDNQLYQVLLNISTPNDIVTSDNTQGFLADMLAEEIPEIETAVAVVPPALYKNTNIISVGDYHIKAKGQYVGKNFFKVFSYHLIQGDINQVLSDKNTVLISDELAQKLFHTTNNIIGKAIQWNQKKFSGTYFVSGIFEKPPANSTAQFDMLFSYDLFMDKYPKLKKWNNQDPLSYVILKKGTDIDVLNTKIAGFIKTKVEHSPCSIFLQQYSDRYLYGKFENGVPVGGRITYVRLFSIIALLILVIACINFMNLSTAKATKRLKEIGVKKTIGASKITLISQYIGEAIVISFLSLFVAIMLVELLLPQFNLITGKYIGLRFDMNLLLSVLGITFFTGIISGSYPAIYLSRFNPVTILKGTISTSIGELWTRKGLVIFQFSISILLIVSVLVVYKQMEFVQTKNLGYVRDNVISFTMPLQLSENLYKQDEKTRIANDIETFLYQVKNIPGIVNASNSWTNIMSNTGQTDNLEWEGKTQNVSFGCLGVGYDYIETLGISMKEGQSFSRDFGSAFSHIIFNEAAIKKMGLTDPIGKVVNCWGVDRQIIGVVNDFHDQLLYENVRPVLFYLDMGAFATNIIVKIQAGTERATTVQLEKFYKEYNRGLPFEFTFLDSDYQALYESENRVAVLSKYFAGVAIIISCLGLFGLAAFTAERRTKEIGIRKVLGSSAFSLVYLLSGDFTKIVLASMLISLPVSYFITNNWLNSFAYRIDLHVWYFIGAGLASLLIARLTVGIQAIKAATANPVESLKYE